MNTTRYDITSRRSLGVLLSHGLICPATSMRGISPQRTHRRPQFAKHIQGEHMLPAPGRGQDSLLCLILREDALAGALGDLLFEGPLQGGGCLGPVSPGRAARR